MLQRRTLLLASMGSLLVPRAGWAASAFKDTTFRVMRKGADIGRHSIAFVPQGDQVRVTTAIDITVKLAFITVASFKQDAVETWQGDQMIAGQSTVVDDGDVSKVEMVADAGELVADGPKGAVRVPLGTMTDISFWNEAIVRKSRLLDTQTTDVFTMTTTGGVAETVDMGDGRTASGIRYDMASNHGRSGQVWYDPDGLFLRTAFTTRGQLLEYYPIA